MSKFWMQVASAPDRANVFVELWLGDVLVAEVIQERGAKEIVLHASEGAGAMDLAAFTEALGRAAAVPLVRELPSTT